MFYALTRLLTMVLFRVLWRPVIEGREHIPPTGPVIVASNHLAFIDSIVIPLAVPRRVVFLAKAEYFEGRSLASLPRRAFFHTFGAVPVARDQQRDAQASLELAAAVLARGDAFGIYPEGTRSRDGRLYRGRTGVGWLAVATGAPVLPVGLVGTDRVQPVGARLPRVHRVRVRFGEPVDPAPYLQGRAPGEVRRLVTDEVMDRIAVLSGQERVATYNERPVEI
ncbi:MAG: 1-acyl-sn-glycerol-3-phosphate acyltransferase [Actinomycetota bacterium]|jgi:1-acyl-sn-glycerol-3-phosphate acyltransferase|nr:1-acyl-sn-glycerol-3-phosphate acyltransferase [Actinomycetota bacterium]